MRRDLKEAEGNALWLVGSVGWLSGTSPLDSRGVQRRRSASTQSGRQPELLPSPLVRSRPAQSPPPPGSVGRVRLYSDADDFEFGHVVEVVVLGHDRDAVRQCRGRNPRVIRLHAPPGVSKGDSVLYLELDRPGPDPREPEQTQAYGDEWASNLRSLALKVPSVFVSHSYNYIIQPSHPSFDSTAVEDHSEFKYDGRILNLIDKAKT